MPNSALQSQGFIENKGQIIDQNYKPNPNVKYLLCTPGFNIQLRQTGFSYDTYTEQIDSSQPKLNLPSHKFRNKIPNNTIRHYYRVDVELQGCNTTAEIISSGKSDTYFNYFTTGKVDSGITNVHHYQAVLYKDIYPNVDLEFNSTNAEYNFIVHPGGKVSDIRLVYKGAVTDLNSGQIEIPLTAGIIREKIPNSFIKALGKQVDVKYISLGNNTYGFSTAKNMPDADLIIDPTPCLDWGTYYGEAGGTEDVEYAMALDKSNNVYITGCTANTSNIATTGAYSTTFGGGASDAFIAKFNSTGSTLLWGTYYGGSGEDIAYGVTLDTANSVYITGYTTSTTGIATSGAYLTTFENIFVSKFNSSGSKLIWGTYYAGVGVGNSIAVDAVNNVYITGETSEPIDVSTTGAYQTSKGSGAYCGYVAKFNSTGSSLVWGTYYGGSGKSELWNLALDRNNNVYVIGYTNCTDSTATPGAYQSVYGGGQNDMEIAKFNSNGTKLLWGTYYGGKGSDVGNAIALDSINQVYITGVTDSSFTGIATPGAWQIFYGGGSGDGVVAKFDSTGSKLIWGTYYGGKGEDALYAIVLDKNDDVYVGGFTDSSFTGIATQESFDSVFGGTSDGIVGKFNSTGSSLLWGTYIGSSKADASFPGVTGVCQAAIAIDNVGDVYVAGHSSDSGIATPGAYQQYSGPSGWNNFFYVAKLGCNIPDGVDEIYSPVGTFDLFPNPNNGTFTIQANESINNVGIDIYNMLGQKVYSNTYPKAANEFTIGLNQPTGIYFYRILKKDGSLVSSGKVIVER